ncbi:MAG: chemotaxis protein CheX [Pseudomonadales bacterium]|uniref:Chemotaxis phosphatase CheX n=1 Tax=Oleiphilus messinensis TaxID=141451 RepID=A0A1Y0I6F0_9GAMM|nr:chemotaxis protein CheX [Oleiphilus messinensis]ARU55800.1 chemotaxis phosphatase CheX [Oleiphilus messinensis]MCG8612451.1 chemotaxis protein CheX [Pseudomonadales bacterium]
MSEKTLQVFIDGVVRYFHHTQDKDVKLGTPYLVENSSPAAFDYTGIIGVSGASKGCVYFTAPSALLRHLLLSLGETDTNSENMVDLVGEVANTISGNARSEFGKDFMISVPVVVQGAPDQIHLPRSMRSYVIPVYWKAYSAAVVISLIQ